MLPRNHTPQTNPGLPIPNPQSSAPDLRHFIALARQKKVFLSIRTQEGIENKHICPVWNPRSRAKSIQKRYISAHFSCQKLRVEPKGLVPSRRPKKMKCANEPTMLLKAKHRPRKSEPSLNPIRTGLNLFEPKMDPIEPKTNLKRIDTRPAPTGPRPVAAGTSNARPRLGRVTGILRTYEHAYKSFDPAEPQQAPLEMGREDVATNPALRHPLGRRFQRRVRRPLPADGRVRHLHAPQRETLARLLLRPL